MANVPVYSTATSYSIAKNPPTGTALHACLYGAAALDQPHSSYSMEVDFLRPTFYKIALRRPKIFCHIHLHRARCEAEETQTEQNLLKSHMVRRWCLACAMQLSATTCDNSRDNFLFSTALTSACEALAARMRLIVRVGGE